MLIFKGFTKKKRLTGEIGMPLLIFYITGPFSPDVNE